MTSYSLSSKSYKYWLTIRKSKRIKVFISVDMESIVGVVSLKHIISDSKEYERARKRMTLEVKAAVEAAKENGAEKIVVANPYGNMINILI